MSQLVLQTKCGRWCLRLAIAAATLLGVSNARAAEGLDPVVKGFVEAHCLRCHGPKSTVSDFRIDLLSPRIGLEDNPQWLEVMERINSGEMPPRDEANLPDAEEGSRIVQWLSGRMQEGEQARLAARGRVTFNRLSREEYVNTVRDLLGVRFEASDPGGFLEDPEWRGIQRIGSVMTLSPSQIDKYLAAAETILAEAYPSKPASMLNFTKRAIGERQVDESHRERLRQLGLLDKVRYEMWPGDIYRYTGSEPLPASGVYEISYTLSGLKPSNGRAPRLFVYETSLDRVLHEQDVIAPEDQPIKVTFQAHLPAGRPNIFVINDVPGPSNNPRSGRHGRTPFISTQEGRIPWQMKLTDEQGRPRYPFLILDTVAFRGPIVTAEEQQRRNHYLPEVATDAVQIRGALHRFATRAFRRPVEPSEVDGFVRVVESELSAGETSLDALKAGMQAILCSKDFLFITEGDERADRSELNNYELATRMSYLFWSTLPDEELLALAERGELSRPEVRAQQALRLLADERASRFSNSFSSQWLQLHKLGQFQPDKKLYPDYDLALQRAMAGETQAYFHQVLTENLTLREFLDSNWTMLNARMAVYYGIEDAGVVGDQFCKVRLPRESHRGGILTQAAVLSMTSDGTRHRPVHRGKWVSEVVFNRVPPPPPANVDPIMPNPLESPKATLRAKLEAHTHDRRCAACHRRIDPFGLAFENFDAIGRWRTAEKTEGTGDDPPVDPSGQLPNGQPFASPEEFKHLLVEDVESFNRAFVEKLASYGMRRATSFVDREELASIAAASRSAGYRLRELVIAFVTSDLFARR